MLDHRRRLRIVDEHEVVVVLELLGVHRVVAADDLLLRLRQAVRVALASPSHKVLVESLRVLNALARATPKPVSLE